MHKVLDVEPASLQCEYEPKFREESLFLKDGNGNRIQCKGDYKQFNAPKLKDMKQYEKDVEYRQKKFREKVQ